MCVSALKLRTYEYSLMSPIKQRKNHNKVHTQERHYDENTDPQHKSNEVAGKTNEIKNAVEKIKLCGRKVCILTIRIIQSAVDVE